MLGRVAQRLAKSWTLGLLLAVAAGFVWYLHHLTNGWMADDAFISARYAENWIDGHGLVFAEERRALPVLEVLPHPHREGQ